MNETTDLNMVGAAPTLEQCAALRSQLLDLAEPGRWFLIAGSLPDGIELRVGTTASVLVLPGTAGTSLGDELQAAPRLLQ